jgi:hypothetical protein
MPIWIKINGNLLDMDCFSDIGYVYENNEHNIECEYKNSKDALLIYCKSKKQAFKAIKSAMKQINKKTKELFEIKDMIEYVPGGEKYEQFKSHFEGLYSIRDGI